MVAMRRMGVPGGPGVVSLAVQLRRVAMVLRGHLVVIRSLLVAVCDVVGVCHGAFPCDGPFVRRAPLGYRHAAPRAGTDYACMTVSRRSVVQQKVARVSGPQLSTASAPHQTSLIRHNIGRRAVPPIDDRL